MRVLSIFEFILASVFVPGEGRGFWDLESWYRFTQVFLSTLTLKIKQLDAIGIAIYPMDPQCMFFVVSTAMGCSLALEDVNAPLPSPRKAETAEKTSSAEDVPPAAAPWIWKVRTMKIIIIVITVVYCSHYCKYSVFSYVAPSQLFILHLIVPCQNIQALWQEWKRNIGNSMS